MWPLLRTLWRVRGGYTATIKFNPDLDATEFGNQYGTGKFSAECYFKISINGKWTANFKWNFDQHWEYESYKEEERQGPFSAQDFSTMTSNASVRARQLAKPSWGISGRTGKDYTDLFAEETNLNKTVDWSFKHAWSGTGTWKDRYTKQVPNAVSQPIVFYH
jgi:hypothetical protein